MTLNGVQNIGEMDSDILQWMADFIMLCTNNKVSSSAPFSRAMEIVLASSHNKVTYFCICKFRVRRKKNTQKRPYEEWADCLPRGRECWGELKKKKYLYRSELKQKWLPQPRSSDSTIPHGLTSCFINQKTELPPCHKSSWFVLLVIIRKIPDH